MTVTLQQLGQVTGVTSIPFYIPDIYGIAVVLNPSLPALIFQYFPQNSSYHTGLIIGTQTQTQLYATSTSQITRIYAYQIPTQLMQNYILTGGYVSGVSGCQSGWYLVYNPSNNNYKTNCNLLPSGYPNSQLFDVVIDYQNKAVYLMHMSLGSASVLIISIPYNDFASFLSNLALPSNYQVGYVQGNISNASSGIFSNVVYYNQTFYIGGQFGGVAYIWTFALSSVSFSSSPPSSPSTVGNVYTIYQNSNVGANNINIFLNVYNDNGTITYEILAYVQTANSPYIYSFNLSTNTATLLYQSPGTIASLTAGFNLYGIIIFAYNINGDTFAVGVYDRKTNSFEASSSISNLLALYMATPNYAVAISGSDPYYGGSSYNINITIYRVLVDVTPQIQNLTFSNNTISGQVINLTDNQPLSGITVYLILLQGQGDSYVTGQIVTSTTTDANGNFSFSITQSGYYAVEVIQ